MALRWYVVQAQAGFESHVKRALQEHVARAIAVQGKFGDILVPTEEVVEVRDGKRQRSERKFFPGYVLVQMEMDDDTWHLVRSVPKVLGFVGGKKDKPAPISEREAEAILQRMQDGVERPKPKVLFQVGESVRIIDGPFADFSGVVNEVDYDRNRLRVELLVFGRSTPVDLGFHQIEKSS